MSQLTGKLLLKSQPGVSADEGLAENECPHHAFGALQREIEPRHREGENEEVEETRRACGVRTLLEKRVFFALSKGRASLFPCALVPSMDEQELKCHLTGCLEMCFFLWLLLSCVPVATFFRSLSTLVLGN